MPADQVPQKLVSIGLPTYNRPELLERALLLLVSQTYRNIEIIVSDNASPDGRVGQVAEGYARNDRRVRYYRQERDIGILANAEFVLRKAYGEYFTWVSDDDWRSPEFVEVLVSLLERNPGVDMAFCDYRAVTESGAAAAGYPGTVLGLYWPFGSRFRVVRTLSHYWQDASRGKSNVFYSVFRKAALASLDLRSISADYHRLNMDNFVVFSMLQRSPLVMSPKVMCTLTCGNEKFYLPGRVVARSGTEYLAKAMAMWRAHAADSALYIKNTSSPLEKVLIVLLYVPRFAVIFLSALARKFLGI